MRKLSNNDIDQRLIGRNIKRIDNINNVRLKTEWECLICKYRWMATADSITNKGSGCPRCCGNVRLTNDVIDQKLVGRDIKRISDAAGIHSKIEWECLICSYNWFAEPNSILNGDRCGCPNCSGKARLTNEIIDQKLIGRNIIRVDGVINARTKIMWECLICNHQWKTTPNKIFSKETGCPECNVPGANEKLVRHLLEQNSFHFEPQYYLTNIDVMVRPLKFDIYIPNLRLAIEYNGEQHYIPTGFFGSKSPDKDFIKQQERDQYKRDFCINKNIQLIEIDGRKYRGKALENHLLIDIIPLIKQKLLV